MRLHGKKRRQMKGPSVPSCCRVVSLKIREKEELLKALINIYTAVINVFLQEQTKKNKNKGSSDFLQPKETGGM